MTAAVLYGSEDLRIEMIDVPHLAADEVLLRVRLALTDGTDLKVWKRGYHAKMIQPPAVFGHEVVGDIAAVGEARGRSLAHWNASGWLRTPRRACVAITAGAARKISARICFSNNGAYAEYMRIPGRIAMENMLEVPHSVDDDSAALVEPLACVLRGIPKWKSATVTLQP